MTSTKATEERVREAYEELLGNGETPSAASVMRVTGGSKSTVLRHLAKIRGDAAGPFVSDSSIGPLQVLADAMASKLWAAARQQAQVACERQIRGLVSIQAGLSEDLETVRQDWEEAFARAEAAEARLREAESASAAANETENQLQALVRMVEGIRDEQRKTPAIPALVAVLQILVNNGGPMEKRDIDREAVTSGYLAPEIQKARWHAVDGEYAAVLEDGRLGITEKGRARVRRRGKAA